MYKEMMRFRIQTAAPLLLFLMVSTGQAAEPDAERGQLLYENHCTVCHASQVHIRDKRKARSEDDVLEWVERWRDHLQLNWGRQEVSDVQRYLYLRYYATTQ